MAKVVKTRVRHVQGFLPSTGGWVDVKIYSDKSIEINRLFCQLDPKKQWETISETDCYPHRHLVDYLASGAWKDITCID